VRRGGGMGTHGLFVPNGAFASTYSSRNAPLSSV
jgi:hypothetical protein